MIQTSEPACDTGTDDYFADPTGTLAERLAMIDFAEALHDGDDHAARGRAWS